MNAVLERPALQSSSSLQRWRELCYITTVDAPSIEYLLHAVAHLLLANSTATACMISYLAADGELVVTAAGTISDETRVWLSRAESQLGPREREPAQHQFSGLHLWSAPLTVGRRRIGVLHLLSADAPLARDDLQIIGVMITNALERHAATIERARSANEALVRHQTMQHAITQVLANAATLSDAAPSVLQACCEGMGWHVGVLWSVDRAAGMLRCTDLWHAADVNVDSFAQFCRSASFTVGQSLLGRVWASGEAAWVPDLVQDVSFPGGLLAAHDRLRSACCFPIMSGGVVRGVVLLCSRTQQPLDRNLTPLLTIYGNQISQFIERRRSEWALRETEERLRAVVATAPVVLYALDHRGVFTVSEGKGLEALGLQPGQVVGQSVFDVYATAPEILADARRALDGETFTSMAHVNDLVFKTRWVPLFNEHGQLGSVIGVATDITDWFEAEQALREREQQFRGTFEQAAMGIAHVALDGHFLRVNQRLCEIIGYDSGELLQCTFIDITHPDDLDMDIDYARRLMLDELPYYQIEKRYIRKDHSHVWVRLTAALMRDEGGEPHYFIAVMDDITDRKQAEAENARLAEELRIERDRLLRREIEVRTQIGRDLHDGPVQQVAVASMGTQYLRRVARHAPEQLDSALVDLDSQLKRSLDDLRTVLYELRPLGIAEEGLVAALSRYIGRITFPDGPQIHLQAPPALRRLSLDHENAIFIIVQEALNNARKHADASNVWIALYDDGSALHAVVRDDGKGFDAVAAQASYVQRGSFGLLNMHERAALIGGTCHIDSQPGAGTTLAITVPYEPTLAA